jgi:hypothetical protein
MLLWEKISNLITIKTMKPDDFGKKLLAEQCQKIRISDFVKASNKQIKEMLIKSSLEMEGYSILLNRSKTGFGGTRYWFSCPICHKRSGVLYKHPVSQILGCRQCLGLDYKKHRYSKMAENNEI